MPQIIDFRVGDVVRLRKPHPCGGYEWTVHRLGADIWLRCDTCGHYVMLPRITLERRLKRFVARGPETDDQTEPVTRGLETGDQTEPSEPMAGS